MIQCFKTPTGIVESATPLRRFFYAYTHTGEASLWPQQGRHNAERHRHSCDNLGNDIVASCPPPLL